MSRLQRRIYGALLRLHPAAFRRQFARDMARDCEDSIRDRGFAALIGDALLSLARQWKSRALAGPEPVPQMESVSGHPLLAGQYVMVDHGWSLSALDLASASVVSVLLLLTIGFAASMPNRRVIADVQTVTVSHDGGLDTPTGNTPLRTHANSAGRREAGGDGDFVASGNGTQHYKGVVRLSRSAAPPIWGQNASGGPRATEPLASALRQFVLISIIVWFTSLLLRRVPGAGRRVAVGALGLLSIAASVAFGAVPKPLTHAQILHAAAPLPSFEVVTVKPWQPPPTPPLPPGAPIRMPVKIAAGTGVHGQVSDQVHFIGQVSLLIALAYNLRIGTESTHIVGLPAWADSEDDRYKVDAKIDSSFLSAMQAMSPASQHEQVQLMQQSLLADRFKLKVHFETRMMPAYDMVIAKGGPKLDPPKPGETLWLTATSTANGTQVTARATTLDDWINSPFLGGREVVNKTGLQGAYDFTLTYSPRADAIADDTSAAPVLTTAIEEQLGLKLVPAKAPIEVIVIDHIEKPTEN